MSALELLDTLRARGVQLAAKGDRLSYEAPAGALDVAMLEVMRAQKAALLELLSSNAEAQAPALIEDAAPPVLVVPAALTPRVLLAAARRIDKRLVLTTAERFELSLALACLDCGIDPQSY